MKSEVETARPAGRWRMLNLTWVAFFLTFVVWYNLGAFSTSAAGIRAAVVAAFPKADITYKVDAKRQGIVDSWPADVDDSSARADWGFAPRYDFDRAFNDYLIPTIRERYRRA